MKNKKFFSKGVLVAFLSIIAMTIPCAQALANNLKIENFNVKSTDTTQNTITYVCNVSWDNSWRNDINYDAIWVFIKYSVDGGATWAHASMGNHGTNPTGFVAPAGFEIVVPNDEKGFFLQRTALGAGNVTAEDVQFVWDYAQDGLSDTTAMAANTINTIFGIEMIYIPEGAFNAGDGNSSSEYRFKQGSADNDPWYIQSESAITTTGAAADGYYYQSTGADGESNTGDAFLIPTSFPKGYQDFYVMKYELTESQWVGFFNTLSTAEKTTRDITSAVAGGKNSDSVIDRNTVAWDATKPLTDATTLRADRPVTYISWADLLAYADWAGLRPITELEYEKAARGKDIAAVPDELAWGNTTANNAESAEIYPNADEDGTETIFDSSANLARNSLAWSSGDGRVGGIAENQIGPLRVGIFAESATTRTSSGAGYYGNMELSGNLYEMIVTLGNSTGRKFLGTHGDGVLSNESGYEGNATNLDWPGIDSVDAARGVTETLGAGYRGGDFQSPNIRHFQISNRTLSAKNPDSEGYQARYDSSFGVYAGGRLGRTAP